MSISEPATALPDGWAQMLIEGRVVTFDTTRLEPGPAASVVMVHMDGRITVEALRKLDPTLHLGPRGGWEIDKLNASRRRLESGAIIVLGVVVG